MSSPRKLRIVTHDQFLEGYVVLQDGVIEVKDWTLVLSLCDGTFLVEDPE